MKQFLTQTLAVLLLAAPGFVQAAQTSSADTEFNPYTMRETAGDASVFGDLQAEDVVFQRTMWRMLDREDDANSPFFYPVNPVGSKQNMITILLDAIRSGKVTAYQPTALGNEFQASLKMTAAQVEAALGAIHDSIAVLDENGRRVWVSRDQESQMEDIQKVLVKEMFYFDKRSAHMQHRTIGICPIRMIPKESADGQDDDLVPQQTFWVPVTAVRDLLANKYVQTGSNEAARMSMEAYLTQHRYEGQIYAVSNARGNQRLADYVPKDSLQIESDMLDAELALFEQKIWR